MRLLFSPQSLLFSTLLAFSTHAIGQDAFIEKWARKPSDTLSDQQQLIVHVRGLCQFQDYCTKPMGKSTKVLRLKKEAHRIWGYHLPLL